MSRSDSRSVSRDRRRDRKRSNSKSSRRSRSNSYREKIETSEARQPLEVENHQSNTNGNNHN